MTITGIVRALVTAGATPEMILAAVEAAEIEAVRKEEKRLERQRERTRRSRLSRDVTARNVTERDVTFAPPQDKKVSPDTPFQKTQLPLHPLQKKPLPTEGSKKRGSRLPDGWHPGETGMAYARSLDFSEPLILWELDKFRDWAISAPGEKGVKRDWLAAWRGWCRRVVEEGATGPPIPNGQFSDHRGQTNERNRQHYQKRSGHDAILAALAERCSDGDEFPWPADDPGNSTLDLSPAANGRGYVL